MTSQYNLKKEKMSNDVDILSFLHHDLLLKILQCLKDPSDIVRFSAVSRSWRDFVITNGLCKHLCLRMFPQLSRVDHVNELGDAAKEHDEAGSSSFMEWEALKREHRVYSFFAQHWSSFIVGNCISDAIIASSTDNNPQESIDNTLEPRERVAHRASYWSSTGQSNPAVPEMLTYKLVADLCIIDEIRIRPFEAYFQPDSPIYSAKYVRFRMGHIKSSVDNCVDESFQDSCIDKFVWTYTSQEFPMAQENRLQNFKLPEPILCIGGILQIELLGRVQRQEMDGLFYICVAHVQVMGRSLSSAFGIQLLDSENFVLEALSYAPQPISPEPTSSASTLQMRVRDLEQILNLLQGNVDGVEYQYGWDIDDEESDDGEDEEEDFNAE